MIFAVLPNVVVFVFLLLYYSSKDKADSKDKAEILSVAFFLLVVSIVVRPLFIEVGGDIAKYQTYISGIELNHIILNEWFNSITMIIIKFLFGEMVYYYQVFTILILVYATAIFSKRFLPAISNVAVMLFLVTPLAYGLTTVAIVFSYAFAVALIALSYINKSQIKLVFFLLLSVSIHWSMLLFFPVIFINQLVVMWGLASILFFAVFFQNNFFSILQLITGFSLDSLMNTEIDRNISPYHIYLLSFLAAVALIHFFYLRSKRIYVDNDSLVLIKLIVFFLMVCFVFIEDSSVLVRVGFFVKFFFLIYLLRMITVLYPKYIQIVAAVVSFGSLLMAFTFPQDRYYSIPGLI